MLKPVYPFEWTPDVGETIEVAPGVHWLRMPLPFKLDHINLWLLEDGDGWTIVDTGIARSEVKEAWKRIAATRFSAEKPLKRVIVTHFHPDHVGLAGWLTERYSVPLWMAITEWSFARMLSLETADSIGPAYHAFYRAAGFDDTMLEAVDSRIGGYARVVSTVPRSLRRIRDGEEIDINGRSWRVMVGTGHAPEHACLYCAELGVLISGDQILPRISPNVSVWPQEPEADPLSLYLASLEKFRSVDAETLVLPSHDWPFHGLHDRLDALASHHDERLVRALAACHEPASAVDALSALFTRELDNHQLVFAIGESLAHLHHLLSNGHVSRVTGPDGINRFAAVAA